MLPPYIKKPKPTEPPKLLIGGRYAFPANTTELVLSFVDQVVKRSGNVSDSDQLAKIVAETAYWCKQFQFTSALVRYALPMREVPPALVELLAAAVEALG